ncbi:MAG: family 43 glycosylhydrolase [Rubrivivax sp.]
MRGPTDPKRRRLVQAAAGLGGTRCAPWAAAALAGCGAVGAPTPEALPASAATLEGQRLADLGDGRYRNPVLAGDWPDPTVVKDGADYYLTCSSFEANPGLLLWHSQDLVNWRPLGHALQRYVGSVWAPELVKHGGRFYLYVPTKHPQGNNIYVLHAPHITGPWSEPVPLGLDRIDPGHAVDENGRRWLFTAGGWRVPLTPDGLALDGPEEKVFEGWRYPEDWDVESYSQEGPKLNFHQGWWTMTLALGGTAGPPTGHMVVAARARSLAGPWEHAPNNPVLRTLKASEAWWSRGHATLVEGPTPGDWYMLLHGYENGYRTLGRQTLLEPIEWTADGWYRMRSRPGDDGSAPRPKPRGGRPVPHGLALSDDFTGPRLAPQWAFFRGDPADAARVRVGAGVLRLAARGRGPADSAPLCFVAGDRHYQVEVDLDFDEGAQAGLLLFYNDKLYAGLGVNARHFVLHRYGMDQRRSAKPAGMARSLRLRLTLREHILTLHSSHDGGASWLKFNTQMEVSGYHHNVAYGFMSLRPAIYAAGQGEVRFSRLRYRALQALASG